MEENQENNKAEELKKETVNAVNEVKETIKKVDIKNDAKETTGFIKEIIKNPLGKIQEISQEKSNKYLKTAVILVIVWLIALVIDNIFSFYSWDFSDIVDKLLGIIKTIISPILGIAVLSITMYYMNKENKKSLITTMTTVTMAKIPKIIASVISLLCLFSSSAYRITSIISNICSAISIVLTYFVIKYLFEENEDSKIFKTFIKVEVIFYIAYFIISFLGISIK